MSFKPFPRQQEAIDKMEKFLNSKTTKKGLFVYPVAFGKSIVIAHVATKFPKKYFINICPNKELTEQNHKRYCSYGYEASICSASLGKNEIGQVTFGTIGTIKKHIGFFKDKEVVILNDEAQNSALKGSQLDKFIKGIKNAKTIGTTATPIRLDSGREGSELKMMNRMRKCFYSSIEDVVQVSEVIENNRWSKLVYEVENVDESLLELNTTGTEFTLKSLKKFSEVNDIVEKAALAAEDLVTQGRKSILVYMPFIEDAEKLQRRLNNAVCVHSKTSKVIRDRAVESFKKGDLQILINCLIFVEGFDYPELSAIINCRPTNSINQYYQMLGRLTRVHPDKKDGKIVDISGNFNKFGKIEELEYCDVEGYGWGMFNGKGELLTNYPLSARYRPTKQSLIDAAKKKEADAKRSKDAAEANPEFKFGMWKGRKVWDIARSNDAKRFFSWASWFLKESEKPSPYPKDYVLLNALREYLQEEANNFGGNKTAPPKKININVPNNLF